MKKNQQGFVGITIIIIIALGILGFGTYKVFYKAPIVEETSNVPIGNFPSDYKPATHQSNTNTTDTGSNQKTITTCGLSVTNISANQKVTFPLVVKGVIDNTNAKKTECSWSMFEGQAGLAQLYVYDIDGKGTGWQQIGPSVPIKVDDWTSLSTAFSVSIGNDQIGFSQSAKPKIVFTEEDPSGKGGADTFELLLILGDASNADTSATQASGFIKAAYIKNNKNYIDIDYVEYVPCASGSPCSSGTGMINNNPKIRSFEIVSYAKILINATCTDKNQCTGEEKTAITFQELSNLFTTPDDQLPRQFPAYLKWNPWDIYLENNIVVKIVEHFRS